MLCFLSQLFTAMKDKTLKHKIQREKRRNMEAQYNKDLEDTKTNTRQLKSFVQEDKLTEL